MEPIISKEITLNLLVNADLNTQLDRREINPRSLFTLDEMIVTYPLEAPARPPKKWYEGWYYRNIDDNEIRQFA